MKRAIPLKSSIVATAIVLLLAQETRAQQPVLSPRDSVELRFGPKRIVVDYGRPSMRGRKIMGGLVPFNRWWRTGANEATGFITDADIILGDSLLPAGRYTLYTLPAARTWKLIINKQTGQWGTVYNSDLDVLRVPMTKKSTESVVDTFTIRLEKKNASSGILRLQWERTDVSVPFRVRDIPNGRATRR